jgi:hypothetical protein
MILRAPVSLVATPRIGRNRRSNYVQRKSMLEDAEAVSIALVQRAFLSLTHHVPIRLPVPHRRALRHILLHASQALAGNVG